VKAATSREGHYTWRDYRTWPDDERWEIIGGVAYAMTPAPTTRHQAISMALTIQLGTHFKGKTCMLFAAPTDIKLSEEDVVQPDLLVVCEKEKLRNTHIEGAPTLIVEILSPSTAVHDRGRKLRLYAASGIREVWIVTPCPPSVEVLVLDGESYRIAGAYGEEDEFNSPTFPDLGIDLNTVFEFPLTPGELRIVKESRAAYGRPKTVEEEQAAQ
jgi:Uma2 family endonuclease